MTNRREFFRRTAMVSAGAVGSATPPPAEAAEEAVAEARAAWVRWLARIAGPVLAGAADDRLKATMPVEVRPGNTLDRRPVSHLEALGRTLAGMAPWLECRGLTADEEDLRGRHAAWARAARANAVDPAAKEHVAFTAAAQCLVDAAFLALGLLRAPTALWDPLDGAVKRRLTAALVATRRFQPGQNNWLLFSSTIEAFLARIGESWKPEPVAAAIDAHEAWYKGDGSYGDGAHFHWDYYNSFVIQPMLLATLEAVGQVDSRWNGRLPVIRRRAVRHAAVQERLIAPDGTYPAVGRSLCYRCGAFHHLAAMALRRELPESLTPAQVRGALSAVIHRTLSPPGTFDERGWLRIGLAGHQPSLAEDYISTGSLYLCTTAFLPLGLPPDDPFWTDPPHPWTSRRIWSGAALPPDHAMSDAAPKDR